MNLLAQKVEDVFGTIQAPEVIKQYGGGAQGINRFINLGVEALFVAAAIIFSFMVFYSALQWIMSGGEKEKIAAAKGRLFNAIIGITLLALSFLIISVIGYILGVKDLQLVNIGGKLPSTTCLPNNPNCVPR